MTKATRTIENETRIITITLTRTVSDKVAYLDGYNLKSGREIYENYNVKMTNKINGATITTDGKPGGFAFFTIQGKFSGKYPAGAYARIGNAYISREAYDMAMTLIAALDAEVGKTEEQIALEAAEVERKQIAAQNEAREQAEQATRNSHPGWCNKCHSYCYGDCTANN